MSDGKASNLAGAGHFRYPRLAETAIEGFRARCYQVVANSVRILRDCCLLLPQRRFCRSAAFVAPQCRGVPLRRLIVVQGIGSGRHTPWSIIQNPTNDQLRYTEPDHVSGSPPRAVDGGATSLPWRLTNNQCGLALQPFDDLGASVVGSVSDFCYSQGWLL